MVKVMAVTRITRWLHVLYEFNIVFSYAVWASIYALEFVFFSHSYRLISNAYTLINAYQLLTQSCAYDLDQALSVD